MFERRERQHRDHIQYFNEPATIFCHPVHDDEQQQKAPALLLQQQQQYSDRAAAAAASAAIAAAATFCTHIKLISRLFRPHLSNHRTHFYTGTKKVKMAHTQKSHPTFEPRTPRAQQQRSTCYSTLFLVDTN